MEAASASIIIDREFSPQEMARITGIPPHLQRTWRKRGILREGGWLGENRSGGWTRWTLQDVIIGKVFKLADELGFARKGSSEVATSGTALHIAIKASIHVYRWLRHFEGAHVIEIDGDIVPTNLHGHEPETRFFVIEHSERGASSYDHEELERRISEHKDASTIAAAIEAGGGQGYAILDFKQIAQDIFDRTAGPLFRIELAPEVAESERK